jgi:PDZ domain-containing secreted protein
MAPRKAKKEQAALRRAALENKAAAQHATLLQEVSLSGEVPKDDDESMSTKLLETAADALTTDDDEKIKSVGEDIRQVRNLKTQVIRFCF